MIAFVGWIDPPVSAISPHCERYSPTTRRECSKRGRRWFYRTIAAQCAENESHDGGFRKASFAANENLGTAATTSRISGEKSSSSGQRKVVHRVGSADDFGGIANQGCLRLTSSSTARARRQMNITNNDAKTRDAWVPSISYNPYLPRCLFPLCFAQDISTAVEFRTGVPCSSRTRDPSWSRVQVHRRTQRSILKEHDSAGTLR